VKTIARLLFLLTLSGVMPEGAPTSPTPAVAQQVRRGVARGQIARARERVLARNQLVRARVARPGPRRAVRRPRRPTLRFFGLFRR
jgi:hypothetical protein